MTSSAGNRPVSIAGVENIDTSYPGFVADLGAVGGRITAEVGLVVDAVDVADLAAAQEFQAGQV